MVAGIEVQQRHGKLRGPKSLLGQAQQADRVLAAGKHQARALELGSHLAQYVDGLSFEILQMVQMITNHLIQCSGGASSRRQVVASSLRRSAQYAISGTYASVARENARSRRRKEAELD